MALVAVSHKPTTAQARQFDGTLESFLDILNARPPAGIVATVSFDDQGQFAHVQLVGGALGGTIDVGIGDWAVFPTDTTQPAFSLPGATAGNDWQTA